jgi:hypothetical protein
MGGRMSDTEHFYDRTLGFVYKMVNGTVRSGTVGEWEEWGVGRMPVVNWDSVRKREMVLMLEREELEKEE